MSTGNIILLIGVIIANLAWCTINSILAKEKNLSAAGIFFASLFFSPLVIWCYLIATFKRPDPFAVDESQERVPSLREI